MFEYHATQKTLNISGIRIGGPPGTIPTVLVPSIFYSKDHLVKNAEIGEVDWIAVNDVLSSLSSLTEKTGIPTMLDVVATTSVAMENYLRKLADITEFPLLIDGSDSPEVNIAGICTAKDYGFLDRVIINSLTPDSKNELYNAINDNGLKNALLLTFDTPSMTSSAKRVEVADRLIQKAEASGVTNILLDTGVMDLPTLGIACKTQDALKNKYGYPVGNGSHNAISTWTGLVPKFGKEVKKVAMAGVNLMPVALGADFVLIGPAKYAPAVYPIIAMADVALSGILIEERIRPEKPHPRYLIG